MQEQKIYIFEEGTLGMNPLQVAALKQFLVNNHFVYSEYNEDAGAVVYTFTIDVWTMTVAYGDECYYCLYNNFTEESFCEDFDNVSLVMRVYDMLSFLKENFRLIPR